MIMDQGLARAWHIQTPEKSVLGYSSEGEDVCAGAE